VPVRIGTLYREGVAQILIVEDDPGIRQALSRALSERGHAVTSAPNALAGLKSAVDDRPDVVLLDLGLPDMDGMSMLQMLRAVSDVPVVVTTARDGDAQVIRLLNQGADDYVVKPFSPDHIDARIRAVLRRVAQVDAGPIVVGGLVIDVGSRSATLDGEPLTLTRREFDLLAYLAAREGQVVTKRELLSEVWQQPYGVGEKTIDVHASWLRRKLGERADDPRYLHSVRGVGLRLSAPEDLTA
jgi:DNA-binding response OmpR family regulator